jgi:hypothetical protein
MSTQGASEWVGREILAPIMASSGITKGITGVSNIVGGSNVIKDAPAITRAIVKAVPFLSSSAVATEAQRMSSTGEPATPTDLATGVIIDGVFNALSKVAAKFAPQIFRTGLNPEGNEAKKMLANATDAVNDHYAGTMGMIKKQAENTLAEQGPILEQAVAKDLGKVAKDELTDGLGDVLDKEARGLNSAGRRAVERMWNEFDRIHSDTLSKTDVLQIKRDMAEQLKSVWEKGADPTMPVKKKVWLAIWKSADYILNKISPVVSDANRKMTVAYSLLGPAEKALKLPAFTFSSFKDLLHMIPGETAFFTGAAQAVSEVGKGLTTTSAKIGARAIKNKESNPLPENPEKKER